MISVGAAIITKDAENMIGRALASVRGVCSQIVVVDTGSTDSTPSVCLRYGAEVYYHKWEEDFSKARNTALSYLSTEWVLAIDSDEELLPCALPENMLSDRKIGGVNLKIENALGDSGEISTHRYTRIFRRHPEIYYEGSIHEQIRPSIERCGYRVENVDITIMHYGYSHPELEKQERNKAMLEQEISSGAESGWLSYHLANTEFSLQNYAKAEPLFIKSLNSGELSTEQAESCRLRLGQISLAGNQYEEAERRLDFSSDNIDTEGLRKYIVAASLMCRKNYQEALKLYKSYEVASSKLVNREVLAKAVMTLEQLAK